MNGSAHRDDANARPRLPFRPLQPVRASRSPSDVPTKTVDTPPREVILTPRATPKPLKRKPSSRPKRTTTKVKSEPPEVNLSRVRPPSPTDDPLLLSGTPPIRSPPLRARLTPIFSSSPSDATRNTPSLSFTARLFDRGTRFNRFGSGSSPDASDLTFGLPAFDAPRIVEETSGAWSDSDEDDFNLKGEYTGKYKLLTVPTKADPPTRETSWGRPVSPFPYSEIMERSLPLSEIAGDGDGREDVEVWEIATEPPASPVELSSPRPVSEDEFAHLDDDLPLFDLGVELIDARPLVIPLEECPNSDATSPEEQEEEEEEEAQIDRELSVAVDDVPGIDIKAVQPISVVEEGSSDEEDDVEGEDVIKITSDDPKAAARAAAILRMHDYDCILAAEKKKRPARSTKSTLQRRKTIENAGVIKSYTDSKNQRWQTLQGTETSPGSRSLPLLELWRDAEDSVFLEHHSMSYCDASFTLSPLKPITTRAEPMLPPPTGKWTRDYWKCLDKCLVAERLAVAARGMGTDLFADTEDISKDAVLDRFESQLGGESVLASLGSGWSRDDLMLRLDVLIRKQSRRVARAAKTARQDGSEPRYRGLLEEAMSLSETREYYNTSSMSAESDNTVIYDALKTNRLFPDDPSPLPSYARGPIRTPSRTPDPRPPHPKDQVHLRHAVLQKSMIPVPVRPKRLVDLRHRSPIKTDRPGSRSTRRSSGCSVKDLVKQYENL